MTHSEYTQRCITVNLKEQIIFENQIYYSRANKVLIPHHLTNPFGYPIGKPTNNLLFLADVAISKEYIDRVIECGRIRNFTYTPAAQLALHTIWHITNSPKMFTQAFDEFIHVFTRFTTVMNIQRNNILQPPAIITEDYVWTVFLQIFYYGIPIPPL
jgi:hypothetical protein